MEFAIGFVLSLAVTGGAAAVGFDRDRAFYPTVLIVVASYYVLFATMGASGPIVIVETLVAGVFLFFAAIGFKTSPWFVAAALLGHGVFDFVHPLVINNPGVPRWWPGFCLAFDVTAAGFLAVLLMKRSRLPLFCFILLAAALQLDVSAQSAGGLVGTWRLVSASTVAADGKTNVAPYGSDPTGFLTYSRDGRMTAIISNGGRKPLSVADRITAPADERAQAFATFLAYAGRYTVEGDKVTHHIEAASIQNWVNGDQVRYFKLDGDHLTVLTPSTYVSGGQAQTFELKWERIK